MHRPRSYSFENNDLPQDTEESEQITLEKELSMKIAARKNRRSKEGFLYIKSSSWLNKCCGIFQSNWERKYAKLFPDRLSLSFSENTSEIFNYSLKGSSVKLSEFQGHNGKHNCILITNNNEDLLISLDNSDELREWIISLTSNAENSYDNYFNF